MQKDKGFRAETNAMCEDRKMFEMQKEEMEKMKKGIKKGTNQNGH